jgi:type IV secretion system protein VirB9
MKDRVSALQLEPGETINMDSGAMVVGNPGSAQEPEWMVGANKAGNMVLIKPSRYAISPETNIIINTNKRTYLLELKLASSISSMTYILRFDYPSPPKIEPSPFKGRDIITNPCDGTINRAYEKRGDMVLSPYEIWDNGTFTCFKFPTNASRPLIYEVLPDGTESLVNSHPVNDITVVHGVSKVYRLRLNKLVLEMRTKANNTGWYNYNGTTTGEVRGLKNATE